MENPRGRRNNKYAASTSSISPKSHPKEFSAFSMEDISKQMAGLDVEDRVVDYRATSCPQMVAPTPRSPFSSYQTSSEAAKQLSNAAQSTPKFKGLDATSPVFIPKTPTKDFVVSTPQLPTPVTPSNYLLEKISTVIKEMPRNVYHNRTPASHQGNQGFEEYGGYQGYLQYLDHNSHDSRSDHAAGYITPGYLTSPPSYQALRYSTDSFHTPSRSPVSMPLSTYYPVDEQHSIVSHLAGRSLAQPLQVPAPRSFLARADYNQKDVLITDSKIVRNIARFYEHYDEFGVRHQRKGDEFSEEKYNLIDHLQDLDEPIRQDFWECNWVEIAVDFRGHEEMTGAAELASGRGFQGNGKGKEIMQPQTTIIDMMKMLGPDFPKYTKTVFVEILLPPADPNGTEVLNLTFAQEQSPQYKLMEELVWILDEFKNIQKLEVILRTQSVSSASPLTIEHINYFLPFFDLEFEDWECKWQASFMTRPEHIVSWPLTYLDRERHKINMRRWNEKKLKENPVFARSPMAAADPPHRVTYGRQSQRQRYNSGSSERA